MLEQQGQHFPFTKGENEGWRYKALHRTQHTQAQWYPLNTFEGSLQRKTKAEVRCNMALGNLCVPSWPGGDHPDSMPCCLHNYMAPSLVLASVQPAQSTERGVQCLHLSLYVLLISSVIMKYKNDLKRTLKLSNRQAKL